MAKVTFEVTVDFGAPARTVWDEMIDWKGHEAWIPMTTVDVHSDDPTAMGASFTAFTGVGPLKLEDRMEVVECAWDDRTSSGTCEVRKLGPVLTGKAGFDVSPADGDPTRSVVEWVEDVDLRLVPGFASGLVGKIGAAGFKQGMRRLAKLLDRRPLGGATRSTAA